MKTCLFLTVGAVALVACSGSDETDPNATGDTRAPLSCEWAGTATNVCSMRIDPQAAAPLDDLTMLTTLAKQLQADIELACREGSRELGLREHESTPCEHFESALEQAVKLTLAEGRLQFDLEEPACQFVTMPCGASTQRHVPVCQGGSVKTFLAADATDLERRTALVLETRYPRFLLANRTLYYTAHMIQGTYERLANVTQPCLGTAESVLDTVRVQLVDELDRTRPVVTLLTDPL